MLKLLYNLLPVYVHTVLYKITGKVIVKIIYEETGDVEYSWETR